MQIFTTHTRTSGRRLTTAVAVAALTLAACGTADDTTEPSDDDTPDVTDTDDADDADGEDAQAGGDAPERIVSLSPTSTEVLFALGVGDRVVAVDDQSDFPEDAPQTDLSGFDPNLEAIAGFDPDVVFLSNDVDGLIDGLESLDIEVAVQPAATTLDDVYDQIEQAAQIVGADDAGEDLAEQLRTDIDALVEAAPDADGLRYYHELDPNLFTATSDTFIGEVYALFGLDNIADEAGEDTPFPQLSPEFVVDADPDVIFVTTDAGEGPDEVGARPGWSTIAAVADDQVHLVDSAIASRWGPRVVDFVEAIAEVLDGAAATA